MSSSGAFPVEVHGFTGEGLKESAGDVDDFTGAGSGDVFVKEVTEVDPAAPPGVSGQSMTPHPSSVCHSRTVPTDCTPSTLTSRGCLVVEIWE